MVNINNTRNIKLDTLLNNKEAVRKFLKSFRVVWNDEFKKARNKEMRIGDDNDSLRGLYLDLSWLYSKRIVVDIEEKVKRRLRAAGKSEHWINLNLHPRVSGEKGEINNDKEFQIRDNELKRINMCGTYLKNGSYESDVPKNFQTTQGKGEDDDLNVEEEEYCSICEKLIGKDDKTRVFVGTDYVACSDACYSKGVSSHRPFHDCSSCSRWIPESIGNTCRTCQKSSQKKKISKCFSCKVKKEIVAIKKGTNQEYCRKCFDDIPLCAYCKKSKCWGKRNGGSKFISHLEGGKGLFFHSRICVESWEKEQKSKSKKPSLQQLRQKYLQKLSALPGWGEFLSEDERDKFKGIILKGLSEDQFKGVVLQVQNLIQTRRGNEDDENNDVLQSQIQKTINEIDFELNKSPKINEEEIDFDLVSWRNYLLGSVDLNQLASRREEILSVVKKIRQQKKKKKQGSELDQVRKEAIQKIREELTKSPPIESEELVSSDWENEINEVQSIVEITQIKSKILAEIRNKRNKGLEEEHFSEFFRQAHEQENWSNYQNLFNILQKIKKLRSSDVYQEEKTKVQDIEKQLQKLNPEKYKEVVELILDQQLENNRLNDSNIDEETKQAIAAAKINPSQENLDKAEEAICQKGADNELTELFEKVETRIKQGNLTKEEREVLIDEIYEFAKKNNYREIACEKKQQAMDVLLDKLLDWEEEENIEQSFLEKYFWPIAIASCLGIVVVSVVLWMKGKAERRVKKI